MELFLLVALLFACSNSFILSSVVSFAIDCDSNMVPIYIHRVYQSSAYKETFQIWEGEPSTGILRYEKNGLDLAGTEGDYEVCLNKVLHTLVLLDAYVFLVIIHL